MSLSDLQWLSVAEATRLVHGGEVRPSEIVEATLDWIERTDVLTHNYVTLLADEAGAEARRVEQRLSAGDALPLAGATYSVKDLVAVRDAPLRANSRVTGDFVAAEDAYVIDRMRCAGAICLGKVATHEFAWGVVCHPSRNPWDGTSVSGGSSGGSGSAVAAGQGQASIGTDCGCSVRNPAALNGICAIRPTYGRVSTSGVIPLSMTMDTVGPLARSAEDIALLLRAMAGFDPSDPASSDAPVPDFASELGEGVAGFRLGVPDDFFFDHVEDGIRKAVEDAIGVLAELGMNVKRVRFPHARYCPRADVAIVNAESATLLDDFLVERGDELGEDVQALLELGNLVTAKDYLHAQQVRMLVCDDFERAFEAVDVVVAPTVAATAKPAPADGFAIAITYADGYAEDAAWAYLRLNTPASLAGVPSLVVPCGLIGGLPTGMQIMSAPFAEATALRVAHAFQQVTSFHLQRPTELLRFAGGRGLVAAGGQGDG